MNISNLGTLRAALKADTDGLVGGIAKAKMSIKGFGAGAPGWVKPVSTAFLGVSAGITASLGVAIHKFTGFEKAMKNVAAVSDATGEEYKKLKGFALEMGSTTAFSAKEAAEGMYYLASAGMGVADQMATTSAVLDLASATQSELAATSSLVVNTLSGFKLKADESRRVADVFAKSISTSQANLSKLSASIPVTSSKFEEMKWSVESNVSALSLLYNTGSRAEKAATGLRNTISSLLKPTSAGAAALKSMGLSASDVDPRLHSLADIVEKLEDANFSSAESIEIFGKENDAMSKLVSAGADSLRDFEDSLNDAAGAAKKMRDQQLDSLAGDFALFKSSVEGAAIAIGEQLAPAIRDVTKAVTAGVNWFNKLDEGTKKTMAWGAAGIAAFTGVAGGAGLLLIQLPKVLLGFKAMRDLSPGLIKGLKGVGAGVLLVTASMWSYRQIRDALKETGANTLENKLKDQTAILQKNRDQYNLIKGALEAYALEGLDPATAKLGDLNINTKDLIGSMSSHAASVTLVDTNLGLLQKRIDISERSIKSLKEQEDEATTATKDLDKVIADLEKGLKDTGDEAENFAKKLLGTEWELISKAFSDYTDITSKGYKLSTEKAIEYWENIEAGGLTTVEAQTGVANKLKDLRDKGAKEDTERLKTKEKEEKDFQDQYAFLKGGEVKVNKKAGEDQRRDDVTRSKEDELRWSKSFDTHREIKMKERGMLREHFDWHFITDKEFHARLTVEANQRGIKADAKADREWEEDHVRTLKGLQDRADLEVFYLRRAEESFIDYSSKQVNLSRASAAELLSIEKGLRLNVETTYDTYLPFFEKWGLDVVTLAKWKADALKAIDKDVTDAAIVGLDRRTSKYERFILREMSDTKEGVAMRKALLTQEYEDNLVLFEEFGGDSVILSKWYAEKLKDIDDEVRESKLRNLGEYSSAFEETLMTDVTKYNAYWQSVDLVSGTFDTAKYNALMSGTLGAVTRSVDETTGSLDDMGFAMGAVEGASARLTDELAGHSLTTAFDEVQESMRGFALGLADNIDVLVGFTDLAEASGAAIVQAEKDKSAKVEQIFQDFLEGKIYSVDIALRKMLEIEQAYYYQVQAMQTKAEQDFLAAETKKQKALELIRGMEQIGLSQYEAAQGPSEWEKVVAEQSRMYSLTYPEIARMRSALPESLKDVSKEAAESSEKLIALERDERILAEATAALSEELAGHSLTTSFEDVQESMRGFGLAIADNVDDITGFTTLSKEAGMELVSAETEKVFKMQQIFEDYMTGKILFANEAQARMFHAEEEYLKKVEVLTAKHSEALLEIEKKRQRALELAWGITREPVDPRAEPEFTMVPTPWGGRVRQPVISPEEQAFFAAGHRAELGGAEQGLVIQIMVENMYGGDEAALNDFAEDLARRILAQNLSISA